MKRIRQRRAYEILTEELENAGWETASQFTIQEGGRPEAEALAWWQLNTPENESSETLRNLAYLRAYLRIAEPLEGRMYARGLFLEQKRLWMDRSIMSRLERDGYISWNDHPREPWFELTENGQSFVEGG